MAEKDIKISDIENAEVKSTDTKYKDLVQKGKKGSNGEPLIRKGKGYEITLRTK